MSKILIIPNVRPGKITCAFKKRNIRKQHFKFQDATERKVLGVNLKFDLQSESYRFILAIMRFYDA